MSNRNRTAGHNFERYCVQKMRDSCYQNVVTSRSESKSRDDSGIDLMNKDEVENGKLEYNIQCKTTAKNVNYSKLMNEMPEGINVILHRKTKKAKTKFITEGEFAIIPMDLFFELISKC